MGCARTQERKRSVDRESAHARKERGEGYDTSDRGSTRSWKDVPRTGIASRTRTTFCTFASRTRRVHRCFRKSAGGTSRGDRWSCGTRHLSDRLHAFLCDGHKRLGVGNGRGARVAGIELAVAVFRDIVVARFALTRSTVKGTIAFHGGSFR